MTSLKKLITGAALAAVGAGCTGCLTHGSVTALGHGFEEESHPYHALIDEPPPPRMSFQYRDTNGVVIPIWPSLYGVNEVIKGDVAIFVGDKAYVDPDRETHPRLFAVKPPSLPLDITDEVLARWAKAAGKNFTQARQQFNLATPVENNGRIDLRVDFGSVDKWTSTRGDWPDQVILQLDWAQVDDIMRTVKEKGVTQSDLRWHTPYIEERF